MKEFPIFAHGTNIPLNPTVRQTQILQYLLDGEATFTALKDSINEIAKLAPEDNDVLIEAFGIVVDEVRFIEPHTLLFSGFDDKGNHAFVTAHYTQVVARTIYLPKREENRVVTGFTVSEN